MKQILIPTDFSETASNALQYALELALLTGANCTLVHAYEMPYDFASQIENRVVAIKKNAREKLQNHVEKLKQDPKYQSIRFDMQVEEGTPEGVVEDLTEDIGADLVVIGLNKHSGWNSFLSGSTGADVIERSRVPVLAVPAQARFKKPGEIVYAASYRKEDLQNLEELAAFARLFDARLRVVHITKKSTQEEKSRFRGFSEEVQGKLSYPNVVQELHVADDVEDGIKQAAGMEGVIISMAHYHKSFLKELFSKSHTEEMAKETLVPLLVFYEKED
jgi:nucleotide-binding universal stress UspA family protein